MAKKNTTATTEWTTPNVATQVNPVALDARSIAVGLLAAVGVGALVFFLAGPTPMAKNGSPRRMRRNEGRPLTAKQKLAAERRARGERKREAAAQTRAARERSRDARLVAIDRARGTDKVCKEARKRKARIRAVARRQKAALDARVARALLRAGGRCAIARSETRDARATLRARREALASARGAQSIVLEQRRRARALDKEQLRARDAVDSALSADLPPAIVHQAARVWFTKSGRFRAPARAAAGRLPRAKLFEAFQEWISENESDLWQSVTARADDPPF